MAVPDWVAQGGYRAAAWAKNRRLRAVVPRRRSYRFDLAADIIHTLPDCLLSRFEAAGSLTIAGIKFLQVADLGGKQVELLREQKQIIDHGPSLRDIGRVTFERAEHIRNRDRNLCVGDAFRRTSPPCPTIGHRPCRPLNASAK